MTWRRMNNTISDVNSQQENDLWAPTANSSPKRQKSFPTFHNFIYSTTLFSSQNSSPYPPHHPTCPHEHSILIHLISVPFTLYIPSYNPSPPFTSHLPLPPWQKAINSVDIIPPTPKVNFSMPLLASENIRSPQKQSCYDRSCSFAARHRTPSEIHTFCSEEKIQKNSFSKFFPHLHRNPLKNHCHTRTALRTIISVHALRSHAVITAIQQFPHWWKKKEKRRKRIIRKLLKIEEFCINSHSLIMEDL